MLPKPCLIIINGPPASGKTTLAKKLGKDLQFPVFHRDEFKEKLFDDLGWEEHILNRKIAFTSYSLIYQILEQFLKSNQSLILESNFSYEYDSPKFEKILKNSGFRVIQVHCQASAKILFQRYQKRILRNRHPGHNDTNRLEEMKNNLQQKHQPLSIENSILIEVNTSNFAKFNYGQLLKDLKFESYYAFLERAFYAAGAFGLIFNRQGQILLCHRNDKDLWSLPGGIIDVNENPWQAVIREVKEETGLNVEISRLVGIYFKARDKAHLNENLLFSFLCEKKSGRLKTSKETGQLKFFSPDNLPLNLSDNHKTRIQDCLKNSPKVIFKTQKFLG